MEHTVFLSLGSNQGEKIQNCTRAISEILKLDSSCLVARSSWYCTEPWGREEQDSFINGVIQVRTRLGPYDLLRQLKEIELQLGRRDNGRWGPRLIDIDILFYDRVTMTSPELEIPHPRVHERNFVLIPMAEIAPHFIHPVFNRAISYLLKSGTDCKKVSKATG